MEFENVSPAVLTLKDLIKACQPYVLARSRVPNFFVRTCIRLLSSTSSACIARDLQIEISTHDCVQGLAKVDNTQSVFAGVNAFINAAVSQAFMTVDGSLSSDNDKHIVTFRDPQALVNNTSIRLHVADHPTGSVTAVVSRVIDERRYEVTFVGEPPRASKVINIFDPAQAGVRRVLFVQNAHFIAANIGALYATVQLLQNRISECGGGRVTIVLVSKADWKPPEELVPYLMYVRDTCMSDADILRFINSRAGMVMPALQPGTPQAREYIEAFRGLTIPEFENIMFKTLERYDYKAFPAKDIRMEKASLLELTRGIRIIEPKRTLETIAGAEAFKRITVALANSERRTPAIRPSGVLLAGHPGNGKTSLAEALAGTLGWPLVIVQFAAMLQKFVGDSEANLQAALDTIDAIGNCVVLFDEFEKAIGGMMAAQSHDSGVGQRFGNILLQWMSSRTSSAFIVATTNGIKDIKLEMLRSGRFDALMFVPMPDQAQRAKIWEIAFKLLEIPMTQEVLESLGVCYSDGQFSGMPDRDGLTGAEIFGCLKMAFVRNITLREALDDGVQVARLNAEAIEGLERYAEMVGMIDANVGGKYRANPIDLNAKVTEIEHKPARRVRK